MDRIRETRRRLTGMDAEKRRGSQRRGAEREEWEAAHLSEMWFLNGVEWCHRGASFSVWLENTQHLCKADAHEFNGDFRTVSELSRPVLTSSTPVIGHGWPWSAWKMAPPNWHAPSVKYTADFEDFVFSNGCKISQWFSCWLHVQLIHLWDWIRYIIKINSPFFLYF